MRVQSDRLNRLRHSYVIETRDYKKIKMADSSSNILLIASIACLACGCDKDPGDRKYLTTDAAAVIVPCLKFILSKLFEASQVISVDLDSLLTKSFVCRNCFKLYKTYVSFDNYELKQCV